MDIFVSATEAARRFSDILNRIAYRGEVFVVERGGKPVCRIQPASPAACRISELARLFESLPRPDEAFSADLERIRREQPATPEPRWSS
jgi:prevent-host-death family protein